MNTVATSTADAEAALDRRDWDAARRALDRLFAPATSVGQPISGSIFAAGGAPPGSAGRTRLAALYARLAFGLQGVDRHDDAIACFERAVLLTPEDARAHNNLGTAFGRALRRKEAVAAYRKALALRPDHAGTHNNLAAVLHGWNKAEAALPHYRRALELDPGDTVCRANLFRALRELCLWDELPALEARLYADLEANLAALRPAGTSPFQTLYMAIDPALRTALHCDHARRLGRALPPPRMPPPRPPRADGRLRLGYVSGDFGDHPVGRLVQDVLRHHDRAAFHVSCYATRAASGAQVRRAVRDNCDSFRDAAALDDDALAAAIAADGIDIAIDLMGYTRFARQGVFARRPAPLQVAWLGYPATTGGAWMDYIVGDETVTADAIADQFTEARVLLPGCYLPYSPAARVAPVPGRAECGLPENGIVFASFNGPVKVEPRVFALWADILARVPGSVLWQRDRGTAIHRHLRAAAVARGIDPARLVFAPTVPFDRHLARHGLIDVFLDTFHYNGHSTAADALWCGVPVVSKRGDAFAERVGASLLHALGLDELIAESDDDYVAIAVALAGDAARRQALRARLAALRRAPLFDPAAPARALDAAFRAIWARHCAGLPPVTLRLDGAAPQEAVSPRPRSQ